MAIPLLTTKFHLPAVRSHVISRPRLLRRLDDGLRPGQRLTLVSAPAGFGKTTLLSEWLSSTPSRMRSTPSRSSHYAWLSLDADDNALGRFIRYIVGALQTIEPDFGLTPLALLRTPMNAEGTFAIEAVLTALINDWAAHSKPLGLVLDDYQNISAQPIHDAVTYLIDHLPSSARLIVASRVDPPLPLARWRASSQLVEVRAADLHFTLEETTAFVNREMGLDLSADEVAALDKRTDGWIAGLHLAALSMQGGSAAASFIATLAASNRYILDYLAEEVMQRQPADVQHFLVRTSILDRLTGSLCDALTDRLNGQAMLERLEQANLFILPLDNDRHWYRYHPLFAEFLRGQLRQVTGTSIAHLHLCASDWYAQHDLRIDAIAHALQAHEFERAAHLIEPLAHDWSFVYNEPDLLRSWLQALPAGCLQTRPRLLLAYAWITIMLGQHAAAETQLRAIQTDAPAIQGEIEAAQTLLAVVGGDVPRTIDLAQQALDHLAPDDSFLRGLVALNLGLAYDQIGDIEAASHAYTQVCTIDHATDNALVALIATVQLADLKVMQGQLPAAAEIYRRAIGQAKQSGQLLHLLSMIYASWGRLLYEWNELENAVRVLTDCVDLGKRWVSSDMVLTGLIQLARVKYAQGEVAIANEVASQAEAALRQHMISPSTITVAKAYQAQLWLKLGNIDAAQHWARNYEARRLPDAPIFLRELEELTLARVFIAQGKFDRAQAVLDPLIRTAQTAGRVSSVIEAQVLRALVHEARGDSAAASDAIQDALALAEPGGYIRTFVDAGSSLKTLLIKAAQHRAYADSVLKAFGTKRPAPSAEVQPAALAEPLSDRELQVLRLIADGLSNQEIAKQLTIANSTVKTHINNIYGKIGAQSRTQAVARARELNLM